MVAVVSPTVPSTAGRAPRHGLWWCQHTCPAYTLVARQAVLRVQRFQSPWAWGRTVVALRRSAPAETWAKSRWEHGMYAVISAYHVVDTGRTFRTMGCSLGNCGMDVDLSSLAGASGRAVSRRERGFLTMGWYRPHPRSVILAYVPALIVSVVVLALSCRTGRGHGGTTQALGQCHQFKREAPSL